MLKHVDRLTSDKYVFSCDSFDRLVIKSRVSITSVVERYILSFPSDSNSFAQPRRAPRASYRSSPIFLLHRLILHN